MHKFHVDYGLKHDKYCGVVITPLNCPVYYPTRGLQGRIGLLNYPKIKNCDICNIKINHTCNNIFHNTIKFTY